MDSRFMEDIIYRFMPANFALDALKRRELKVSLIPDLNDVFDCTPSAGPLDERGEFVGRDFTQYQIDLAPRANGLLCFCKKYHSPVHWGHYAAKTTGIALGL